jgi:hypothetical protein
MSSEPVAFKYFFSIAPNIRQLPSLCNNVGVLDAANSCLDAAYFGARAFLPVQARVYVRVCMSICCGVARRSTQSTAGSITTAPGSAPMCRTCVFEQFPDRGRVCLVSGAYVLNFKSCGKCLKRDGLPLVVRKDGTAVGPLGTLLRLTSDAKNRASGMTAEEHFADTGDVSGGGGAAAADGTGSSNINSSGDEDSDSDGESKEETEFDHRCLHCGHVVATHYHARICSRVDRVDMMECALCGRGHWKRRPLELGVCEAVGGGEGSVIEGCGADARPPEHAAYQKQPWQRTDGVAAQLLTQRGSDFDESDEATDVDGDDAQWSE